MRLPKLRELKEAVTAVISPRFTTRFPVEPCTVPKKYRGKPEFDLDTCIGCGACVNVCPTRALTMVDDTKAKLPLRKISARYDACIFCGNCHENCTAGTGINLTQEWDLAGLNRADMVKTYEYELQMCEKCGALIGTKKHILWLYDKLGPLAYTNPSLLLTQSSRLHNEFNNTNLSPSTNIVTSDFMRILCPKCKCELNMRL